MPLMHVLFSKEGYVFWILWINEMNIRGGAYKKKWVY